MHESEPIYVDLVPATEALVSSVPNAARVAEALGALRVAIIEMNPITSEMRTIEREVRTALDPAEWNSHLDLLLNIGIRSAEMTIARSELDQVVAAARSRDIPWSHIARAVGITPPAAWRRWDPEARKKHSDYQRERKRQAR